MVNNQERITTVFAALADPTRRRILLQLADNVERPVTALAKPFPISPPAVSRHLRVLEDAQLINRRRQGRIHLIRARPVGLKKAQQWINQCAAAWEFSLDALETLIAKEQQKEEKP